jgi:hypothetical protein
MLEWGCIRINNTLVWWKEVPRESITHWYGGMRHHENQQYIMCYRFSWDPMPAYWCVIYSHVTSSQHTNVLSILRWPHHSILRYCWFSWHLIPPYWCVIDSPVTLFQHTDVLLVLRWSISSILMCYWISCDLIPAYKYVTSVWWNGVPWESITH